MSSLVLVLVLVVSSKSLISVMMIIAIIFEHIICCFEGTMGAFMTDRWQEKGQAEGGKKRGLLSPNSLMVDLC